MSKKQPNILWIFSDQHRAHAIGCYGDPNIETPNLDRLAREGIRFTNAYSNTPLCSPFRASLYTGQYISTHGVISLFRPLLPEKQPELAEALRRNGYHTSHMGKWHLSGGDCPCHFVSPYFRPGWDDWLGWENSNDFLNTTYSIGDHPHPVRRLEGYQTDALTDLTVEWLREHADSGPWFHVMSIEPPHGAMPQLYPDNPNFAPEPYMAMFRGKPLQYRPNFASNHPRRAEFERNLRGYYAQIKNLDDNIGRVIQVLEETHQLDNTVIFYFSDHGDLMGSHGMLHKCRPEEESSNIPLIVRYPVRIPANTVSDALISAVDIMPTLLGFLGIPVPEGVEGQDLSPVLEGRRGKGAELVLMQFESAFFPETPQTAFRAIRTGHWLYSFFLTRGPAQLFNMQNDPYQQANLISSPEAGGIRGELHRMMEAKVAEFGDDFLERAKRYSTGNKGLSG
ncbi:MAG: sulfatase [Planctomycetota bacterium]